MALTRAGFSQSSLAATPEGRTALPALKRSHVVAIAAVGFVAVAGSLTASWTETEKLGGEFAMMDAAGDATQTQQGSGSRLPVIIPIFVPGPRPAAMPAPAAAPSLAATKPSAAPAQSTVARGGFGDTSRTMASSPQRSAVSG